MSNKVIALVALLICALAALAAADLNAETVPAYTKWLEERGLSDRAPKLELHEFEDGWGVRAKSDIKAGEELLVVDDEDMMSWKSAGSSKIAAALSESYRVVNEHMSMVLHLLYESGREDSTWGPFLDTLPKHINSPLLWTDGELEELKGSTTMVLVRKDRERAKRDYAQVIKKMRRWYPDLFTPEITAKKKFLWAYQVLWANSFTVSLWSGNDEQGYRPATVLVPLLDAFREGDAEQVHGEYQGSARRFRLLANVDIAAGEEITMTRQAISTSDDLITNGQVRDGDESADYVRLTCKLSKKDFFYDDRADTLDAYELYRDDIFNVRANEDLPEELMTFARILRARQADLAKRDMRKKFHPVNERDALKYVLSQFEKARDGYATTLAEDEAADLDALLPRPRMALVVRRSEKRILANQIERVSALLADAEAEVEAYKAKHGKKTEEKSEL